MGEANIQVVVVSRCLSPGLTRRLLGLLDRSIGVTIYTSRPDSRGCAWIHVAALNMLGVTKLVKLFDSPIVLTRRDLVYVLIAAGALIALIALIEPSIVVAAILATVATFLYMGVGRVAQYLHFRLAYTRVGERFRSEPLLRVFYADEDLFKTSDALLLVDYRAYRLVDENNVEEYDRYKLLELIEGLEEKSSMAHYEYC